MSDNDKKANFSDVESRRSASSSRRLSLGRRLYYFIGLPVLMGVIKLLWSTYRVKRVIGQDIADQYMGADGVSAPCYWHQHLMLGNLLMRQQIENGFRPCFLVSASVDGDVPSRIAEYWGAEVIRGSANNTGALVLRDMHQAFKRGVSVVSVADGPNGPQHEFKVGVVLMARIAGVPMIPVGFAVDRAWHLDRWDRFMIPKPFARVVMAVGEPVEVPRATPVDELEHFRNTMENAVNSLADLSKQELEGKLE
jgi:lysophospholipid acyltransferase (LPLAT)-like uncharacterized protein